MYGMRDVGALERGYDGVHWWHRGCHQVDETGAE